MPSLLNEALVTSIFADFIDNSSRIQESYARRLWFDPLRNSGTPPGTSHQAEPLAVGYGNIHNIRINFLYDEPAIEMAYAYVSDKSPIVTHLMHLKVYEEVKMDPSKLYLHVVKEGKCRARLVTDESGMDLFGPPSDNQCLIVSACNAKSPEASSRVDALVEPVGVNAPKWRQCRPGREPRVGVGRKGVRGVPEVVGRARAANGGGRDPVEEVPGLPREGPRGERDPREPRGGYGVDTGVLASNPGVPPVRYTKQGRGAEAKKPERKRSVAFTSKRSCAKVSDTSWSVTSRCRPEEEMESGEASKEDPPLTCSIIDRAHVSVTAYEESFVRVVNVPTN
ncbi:hypothetical protein COOONC_04323 [Cooperia oncophora]